MLITQFQPLPPLLLVSHFQTRQVPLVQLIGGTGLTSYATGDLIYASGANTLANRTIGTTGQILAVSGGVPTWTSTSTLGLGNGTFLGLSDTPSSYTANRIMFTNSGAQALTVQISPMMGQTWD